MRISFIALCTVCMIGCGASALTPQPDVLRRNPHPEDWPKLVGKPVVFEGTAIAHRGKQHMRGIWTFGDGCTQAIMFGNLSIGVSDLDLAPYNEETVVVRGILHTNYVPASPPQAGMTGPHDVYFLAINEIIPKGTAEPDAAPERGSRAAPDE